MTQLSTKNLQSIKYHGALRTYNWSMHALVSQFYEKSYLMRLKCHLSAF